MEPENTPLEKENHLPNHHFQVLCQSSGVYVILWTRPSPNQPNTAIWLVFARLCDGRQLFGHSGQSSAERPGEAKAQRLILTKVVFPKNPIFPLKHGETFWGPPPKNTSAKYKFPYPSNWRILGFVFGVDKLIVVGWGQNSSDQTAGLVTPNGGEKDQGIPPKR